MSTLAKALALPSIEDEIAAICATDSLLRSTTHIKKLLKNEHARSPEHLREIFESALAREVRAKPQRRAVIQALKNAKAKLPNPPAKVVSKAGFSKILAESVNRSSSQLSTLNPQPLPDPAWDNARLYFRAVKTTGRQFIVAQICLGWELHNRKTALGFTHGNNQHSKDAQLGHPRKTWQEWLHSEIDPDLTRQTADRLIMVYQGFCEKCPKRLRVTFQGGSRRSLITALSKPPATLAAKDRQIIEAAIAKASDGETQRSLLEELSLVKAHKPLTGGDTSAHRKDKPSDAELMGQLAFKFFLPIAEGLHSLRTSPDSAAFLHTIPITSSEADEISLTTLENDLEAALHDVRAAKKARLKPAAGKVIPSL
jgi:hypothetical protein